VLIEDYTIKDTPTIPTINSRFDTRVRNKNKKLERNRRVINIVKEEANLSNLV